AQRVIVTGLPPPQPQPTHRALLSPSGDGLPIRAGRTQSEDDSAGIKPPAELSCRRWRQSGYAGSSTSVPTKGTSASGTRTLPSGRWWFSRIATSQRVGARGPLSVAAIWGLA